MSTKLIKDISASTTQVILNQALGVLIFIITSRYLDKPVYGELNWSLAILVFFTTVLSLRLEQIIVKKVASGDDPSKMLTLFSGHILFSGIIFYLALLAGNFFFPIFFNHHSLLLILAISQLFSFFSMPFKQLASGKGKFGWLAVMSSVANLIRAVWLLCVVLFSSLDIHQVLVIYIISSLTEWIISIIVVQYKLQVRITTRWMMKDYFILLHESLPQIGVVFLNACIARIDWILLGIFSTQAITAEYSFAYKVFELSPIPILIIGPVLLTRFSGYFQHNTDELLTEKQMDLGFLIRIEMILATFLPLLLNIAWAPLMDMLTQNKYGSVNKTTFLLLSCCIPLQYLVNLFWTIHFSQNHLSLILKVTAVTCMVIVVGDLFMIPLFNAKGAALTYLTAMAVEYVVYARCSSFINTRDKWMPLIICVLIAFISGLIVDNINTPVIPKLLISSVIYGVLIVTGGQIKRTDIVLIKRWFLIRQIQYTP